MSGGRYRIGCIGCATLSGVKVGCSCGSRWTYGGGELGTRLSFFSSFPATLSKRSFSRRWTDGWAGAENLGGGEGGEDCFSSAGEDNGKKSPVMNGGAADILIRDSSIQFRKFYACRRKVAGMRRRKEVLMYVGCTRRNCSPKYSPFHPIIFHWLMSPWLVIEHDSILRLSDVSQRWRKRSKMVRDKRYKTGDDATFACSAAFIIRSFYRCIVVVLTLTRSFGYSNRSFE